MIFIGLVPILLNEIWSKHFLCTFSCDAFDYTEQRVDKICSRVPGLSMSYVYPQDSSSLDVPCSLLGSACPESVSMRRHDASQRRNHPQGGKCQADKPEPIMNPQPSHEKDNSEYSAMLPFGFVPLGTQVWTLGRRGLQVETKKAVFTKIFWDTEDSDDLNSPKPQYLSVPTWLEKADPSLLRLIQSCLKIA